jgi:formyl-CoA transferase
VPNKVGTLVVDVFSGLSAFAACQAALAERARDRAQGAPARRRHLDVSLMQAAASLMVLPIAESGLLGRMPAEMNFPAGTWPTKDGAFVMIAMVREEEFVTLCGELGRPDLPQDERFASFPQRAANKAQLRPILEDAFRAKTAAEWVTQLQAARMLCDRVNTPLEWLADAHVQSVGAAPLFTQAPLGTLPFPVIPGLGAATAPAPGLGEHDHILSELGI